MSLPRHHVSLAIVALLMAGVSVARADDGDGFVDLFNSKDLTGWSNPFEHGKAWVEEGVIHLQGDRKFFLVTDKKYGDFVLEAEIMLPAQGPANSGIMFRCHAEKNKVFGYQAECDPTDRAWTGGLYDEGRRGWLFPKANEKGKTKLVKAPLGEWVKYRIEAVGDHLQISINGQKTTDFHDATDASGHIGIQHHGEKGKTYKFRNIRIQELAAAGTAKDAAASESSAPEAPEAADDHADAGWVVLFDGKTLEGWTQHGGSAKYEVKDGAIVGTSVPNTHNSFMCTNQTYTDFELEFEVKVHAQLNSGVQIRSKVRKEGDRETVFGPQVEIEASPGESGYVYGESMGGGWISKPQRHDRFKNGEWNSYRVVAQGNRVQTWINGEQVEDLTNDRLVAEGFIGLQVHGVGKRADPLWAMWRNIRIKTLNAAAAAERSLIGNDLAGWRATPGGAWRVENGVLIGTSAKSESRHGILLSDAEYGDFALRTRFRVIEGNSGIYFRVQKVDHPVAVKGFQAEVDRTLATGGLYETLGREWVAKPNTDALRPRYTPGEWADMQIEARGGHVVVRVNEVTTAELTDDSGSKRGHIGLQLHGGQDMHVEFTEMFIREL